MSTTPAPSAEIPVEQLGPAGVKGELHILAIMPNESRNDQERLQDQSERQFKVAGRLSKAPPSAEGIKGDFGPEDGGSYLLLPDEAVLGRVRCAEGMFEFKKNRLGEKSLVEFECIARNTTDARKKFQSAVLPFLDYLAYLANCPIVVSTVRVEDKKNDRTTIEYVSPYRNATVNLHVSTLFIEMAPVYALYREAKNSNSDFYRFLCYYKLLEGLLGTLRANVFIRARDKGVTLKRPKENVPAFEGVPTQFQAVVGTSIKAFFDAVLTPQFRNAVAHFVTDDGAILNMSAPAHIESYAEILFISEVCVRAMIASHELLLQALQAQRGA